MTFSSEVVRILFHQMPTEVQVQYAEMEVRMAKHGQTIRIDDVKINETCTEVTLRLGYNFKSRATIPSDSRPLGDEV